MTKRNEDEEVDDRFVQRAPLKRSDRPRVDAVGADRRAGGGPLTSSLWDRTVGQIAVTAAGRVYKRDKTGRFDSHGATIAPGSRKAGKFPGEQDRAEFQAGWKEYEENRAKWINSLYEENRAKWANGL